MRDNSASLVNDNITFRNEPRISSGFAPSLFEHRAVVKKNFIGVHGQNEKRDVDCGGVGPRSKKSGCIDAERDFIFMKLQLN